MLPFMQDNLSAEYYGAQPRIMSYICIYCCLHAFQWEKLSKHKCHSRYIKSCYNKPTSLVNIAGATRAGCQTNKSASSSD